MRVKRKFFCLSVCLFIEYICKTKNSLADEIANVNYSRRRTPKYKKEQKKTINIPQDS